MAQDRYAEALACWRGPVLADLPARLQRHPAATVLARRRIDAVLAYADLAIAAGLAANAGATTRELMHRMGHGSVRADLIYQHATAERDRQIADAPAELTNSTQTARTGSVGSARSDGTVDAGQAVERATGIEPA